MRPVKEQQAQNSEQKKQQSKKIDMNVNLSHLRLRSQDSDSVNFWMKENKTNFISNPAQIVKALQKCRYRSLAGGVRDGLRLVEYPPFTTILQEHKSCQQGFVLVQGQILVFSRSRAQKKLTELGIHHIDMLALAELAQNFGSLVEQLSGSPFFIGQHVIRKEEPRQTFVTCKTSLLLVVSGQLLQQLIKEQMAMQDALTARLVGLVPEIKAESPRQLSRYLRYFYFQKLSKGSVIIKEGVRSQCVYFLLQGQCTVYALSGQLSFAVTVLDRGQVLGLQFLRDQKAKSKYRICAKDNVSCICIQLKHISRLPDWWVAHFCDLSSANLASERERDFLLNKYSSVREPRFKHLVYQAQLPTINKIQLEPDPKHQQHRYQHESSQLEAGTQIQTYFQDCRVLKLINLVSVVFFIMLSNKHQVFVRS